MFIFPIYNSFDTEGHSVDKGDFSTENFNSIKMAVK